MSDKQTKKDRIYSTLVFDSRAQKEYLDSDTKKALDDAVSNGTKLSLETADKIAKAMKDWAISKGATHFTHWFQPLTGTTSEKHDSFLVPAGHAGHAMYSFSGKDLIKGESDASSFPTGGLRSTFEARGYTAWDPSSNAFIKDEVLCIPTAFCSYNGDAIDKKTPLLRSMDALKFQVIRFMRLFGKDINNVVVNVGAEQEFFLISNKHFNEREDLVTTGRTLFGNPPVKGQDIEEHYFGSITPKINEYMKKLDDELWSLGISAHTKHNEAAPSQMELAPIFCNANRAIDENLITMEKMKLIAPDFDMACLLHERPFEGINGSGKHCNWSVNADDINLLDPGKTDLEHLRFVSVIACVMAAVDEYQELLRMSVANISNDRRLGANEAPPAIVSIFLGDALEELIDAVASGKNLDCLRKQAMDLGVSVIPWIMRDAADRNRTSPFAFNDNKFEFRMPGSRSNLSDCVVVLNTAFTKALCDFCDHIDSLLKKSAKSELDKDLNKIVLDVCADTIDKHKRIMFDGDGYSDAWQEEAKIRGLANNKTTADSLEILKEESTVALFEKFNVLSKREIESRYKIKLEKYIKQMQIECRVMQRMVKRLYLPSISNYIGLVARQLNSIVSAENGYAQNFAKLGKSVSETKLFVEKNKRHALDYHKNLLNELINGIDDIANNLNYMVELNAEGQKIIDNQEQSYFYAYNVSDAMDKLRQSVDKMEHIMPAESWPVPSYNEILFYY